MTQRQRPDTMSVGDHWRVDRRAWMAGAVAALWPLTLRADDKAGSGSVADEEIEERTVAALGAKAGLKPFRASRSPHYLAVGDAADTFRMLTLRDLETLAVDFLDHYRAHGFAVSPPSQRLTVVVLADERSFAAFTAGKTFAIAPKRGDALPTIHGLFNPGTNRLVVFDHRSLGPQLTARAGADNLRHLAHEGTHQLCFNTGLLQRKGDVPRCVAEGLAMYGEVRSQSGRSAPGQLNRMRLTDLAGVQRRRVPWLPVDRLLADDQPLAQPASFPGLLAYAESWLLVDYLMKDAARCAGFRAYLDAARHRRDPKSRLDDARAHMGDLDRLDRELHAYSVRLLRNL